MTWVGTETDEASCAAALIEVRSEEAQEGEPKEEMDVDKEDGGGKGWNKEVVIVPVYSQHHYESQPEAERSCCMRTK